jgi:hypothetical protein
MSNSGAELARSSAGALRHGLRHRSCRRSPVHAKISLSKNYIAAQCLGWEHKKKRGPRLQPSPPCQRVTKPVKVSPRWRPAERLSRRSREHRPTVGVLEPPQVTPMCLLGSPLWHSGPSKHRAAGLPSENQQRLCRGQVGPTVGNSELTFYRCRLPKSSLCYETSGLLPSGHTPLWPA